MPFYQDTESVRSIMQEVFDRLNAMPGAIDDFTKHGMVVSIYLDHPKTFIGLDGRQSPVGITFAPDGSRSDLAIRLDADLLHEILLGRTRLRDAYLAGRSRLRGLSSKP